MNLTSIAFLKAILLIVLLRQNIAYCGRTRGYNSQETTQATSSGSLYGFNKNNSNNSSTGTTGVAEHSESSGGNSSSHSSSSQGSTGDQDQNESQVTTGDQSTGLTEGQDQDQSKGSTGDQDQDQSKGSSGDQDQSEDTSESKEANESQDQDQSQVTTGDQSTGLTEGQDQDQSKGSTGDQDQDQSKGSSGDQDQSEDTSESKEANESQDQDQSQVTTGDQSTGLTEGQDQDQSKGSTGDQDQDQSKGSSGDQDQSEDTSESKEANESQDSTQSQDSTETADSKKPGEKKAVELDLKDTKSTATFDCLKKDGYAKYTAKSGYGFSLVKTKTGFLSSSSVNIWSAKETKIYATAVVRDGTGFFSQINNVTIFFGKNHRHFNKSNNTYVEDSNIRLHGSDTSSTPNQTDGTGYTKNEGGDVFTFAFNDTKYNEIKFVKRSLENDSSAKTNIAEETVWKHHDQLYGEKYPKRLRYYFPNKMALTFDDSFIVYTKDDEKWKEKGFFKFKLYANDSDNNLEELDATAYDIADTKNDHVFTFKDDVKLVELKHKGKEFWKYKDKYPLALRHKKDGFKLVMGFSDSFAVCEMDSDNNVKITEFFMKLYRQDPNDSNETLELHGADYDLNDEDDKFTFVLGQNAKCSMVKVDGKELWTYNSSNSNDSHPTEVLYWKDRNKVIIDFADSFNYYQKGADGQFGDPKMFDIKLYSKDPNVTQFVPLNHSNYDLIEDSDDYEFNFKEDAKFSSVKLSGNEVWKHDQSKHGDEHPVSLRYKKGGSMLLIDSEGYFVLCNKDGDKFKVNELFIKLYRQDPNDSDEILELHGADYDLNDEDDKFTFVLGQNAKCSMVKVDGKELWTYDSFDPDDSNPIGVLYWKDRKKVIVDFADSFNIYQKGADGQFGDPKRLDIKLYSKDPNDDTQLVPLNHSKYDLIEDSDKYLLKFKEHAKFSSVKLFGNQVWKHDQSKHNNEHPVLLRYKKDGSMLSIDSEGSFLLCNKDGDDFKINEFFIKLYTFDSSTEQFTELSFSEYQLNEYSDEFEFKFKRGHFCDEIKYKGNKVWTYDPKKYNDEYPSYVRYKKDGSEFVIRFRDSFLLYEMDSDNNVKITEFFIKLYRQDPNDYNEILELHGADYDLNDEDDKFTFVLGQNAKCSIVKMEGKELWKHDSSKPGDSNPTGVLYWKDRKKVILDFADSFNIYQKGSGGGFGDAKRLDIKLYSKDPNDDTQLVPLNHSNYDLTEHSNKYELMFKENAKFSSVKYFGNEVWKHDQSKHGDEHPKRLRYYFPNKMALTFEDSFIVYIMTYDGKWKEQGLYKFKLYSQGSDKLEELDATAYDIADTKNDHVFTFKDDVKLVELKHKGKEFWKYKDKYPLALRHKKDGSKFVMGFPDSFVVYEMDSDNNVKITEFFIKLYRQDPNDSNEILELHGADYDLNKEDDKFTFVLGKNVNCSMVTMEGKELWKHDSSNSNDSHPTGVLYWKDRNKVILDFPTFFNLYQKGSGGGFGDAKRLDIKLYSKDPNDTQLVPLNHSKYDLIEDSNKYDFIFKEDSKFSSVKLFGSEVWKHDKSKHGDYYPISLRYKKDNSILSIHFERLFALCKKDDELIELSFLEYQLNEYFDEFEFKFKRGHFCDEIKYKGAKVWTYDPTKYNDEYPYCVRYKKDGSKFVIRFRDSFLLYEMDSDNNVKITEFFIKLYRQDPNDLTKTLELHGSDYDLNDEDDKFTFVLGQNAKCSIVKMEGKELWKHDSSKPGDSNPTGVLYWKDRKKVILDFADSFNIYQKGSGGGFGDAKRLDIKLYSKDPNDTQLVPLNHSKYDLTEHSDKYELKFKEDAKFSSVKYFGNEVWKHDQSKHGDEHPVLLRYNKDGSMLSIDSEGYFALCNKDGDEFKVDEFFIKLYTFDSSTEQFTELSFSEYQLNEYSDEFEFKFKRGHFCDEIKYKGAKVWTYDPKKYNDEYPSYVRYKKDGSEFVIRFRDSFLLYEMDSDNNVKITEFFIKLYRQDPNDLTKTLELHGSDYDLNDEDDKFTFVLGQNAKCSIVKMEGKELWKHDSSKPGDSNPTGVLYWKDRKKVILDFADSFNIYQKTADGQFVEPKTFDIKLYSNDPNDDTQLVQLNHSNYDLIEHSDDYEFKFKEDAKFSSVKLFGSEVWKHDQSKHGDEYPASLRYNKDGPMLSIDSEGYFVLCNKDGDEFKVDEFFIKLYRQDPNDSNETLELHGADYDLNDEDDKFTFVLGQNAKCSIVKMEGKELWKHDSSKPGDSNPTGVLYWKDRKKVILDFTDSFNIYQKTADGQFVEPKTFDIKLYSNDPNDDTQLVQLNHSNYDLIEHSDDYEFKFKEDAKFSSVKLFGSEVWKHDQSKHGDEYPASLRYNKDGSMLSIDSEGYFVLCNKDGDEFKVDEFFIKLYRQDPNDSNETLELHGADYDLNDEDDKFTFVLGQNAKCSIVKMEGKELWKHDSSKPGDSNPTGVLYWKDRKKVILDFADSFNIYQKTADGQFVEPKTFDIKLYSNDPNDDTQLVQLNHSNYDLIEHSDDYEFKFKEDAKFSSVKLFGSEVWKHDQSKHGDEYPASLRYNKDNFKLVIGFSDFYVVCEMDSDNNVKKTEFFIKLYRQDPNDLTKTLELHGSDYDLNDEDDKFTFVLGQNAKCSIVKMEGKELWKHDSSKPGDSNPTGVLYWKDRKKVILDFADSFNIYQKTADGQFVEPKTFDIKLYSNDPNDDTQLVQLNHSNYDLIDHSDDYEFKFKEDAKFSSVKLFGSEVWKHDQSKHGDEYPASLRYNKDGSMLSIDSEGYFVLCNKDGDEFKVDEFFIKLYRQDPNDSNETLELHGADYDLNDEDDKFTFVLGQNAKCSIVKMEGKELWKHDSSKPGDSNPTGVLYWKDRKKVILDFADSFNIYQKTADGQFVEPKTFDIKLYSNDPNDDTQLVQLNHSNYDLIEHSDDYEFKFKEDAKFSSVKLFGSEVWKHDQSKHGDEYPASLRYNKDNFKLVMGFSDFFAVYEMDSDNNVKKTEFFIKLYRQDPNDLTKTLELHGSDYDLNDEDDKFTFVLGQNAKCSMVKVDGKELWTYDSSKPGTSYPTEVLYWKDRNKVILDFPTFFNLYQKGADDQFGDPKRFDIKLYSKDPNDDTQLVPLNYSNYDLTLGSDKYDFIFKEGVNCGFIKLSGNEVWKHDRHKHGSEYPKRLRYYFSNKVALTFDDSFIVYTKNDEKWEGGNLFAFKLYANDSGELKELDATAYDITDYPSEHVFTFKDDVKLVELKHKGKEFWKYKDKYPLALRYKKDGSKFVMVFSDSFAVYEIDSDNNVHETEFFIKLYRQDPNDSNEILELHGSDYDLNDEDDKFTFVLGQNAKCSMVKVDGKELWTYDSSKPGDSHTTGVLYWKDRNKVILDFPTFFNLYQKGADDQFGDPKRFDIKLYSKDPNDDTQLVPLNYSNYDLTLGSDKYDFIFKEGVNCGFIKLSGNEVWKHDRHKHGSEYPKRLRYYFSNKVALTFDDSFIVYTKNDEKWEGGNLFAFKLYANDSGELKELDATAYDITDYPSEHVFTFKDDVKLVELKHKGKEFWKYKDKYPLALRYKKDGSKFVMVFSDSFAVYEIDSDNNVHETEFFIKLYRQDPNDSNEILELHGSDYDLNDEDDKFTFVLGQNAKCSMVKVDGKELWTYDSSKPGDSHTTGVLYWKDRNKVILDFPTFFNLYQKGADDQFGDPKRFDIKLYSKDPNDDTQLVPLNYSNYDLTLGSDKYDFIFKEGVNCGFIKLSGNEVWKHDRHKHGSEYPKRLRYYFSNKVALTFDDSFIVYTKDSRGKWDSGLLFPLKLYTIVSENKLEELDATAYDISSWSTEYFIKFKQDVKLVEVKHKGNKVWEYNSSEYTKYPDSLRYKKDDSAFLINMGDSFLLFSKSGETFRRNDYT
ncbi:hypothetical protein MACJ_000470 [Theileria orientalis]|uniref:SfiI-subtelomeric related protein family member n=1 Tax=Theileria orientalis TaxID=68886 RepID=A0A976M6D7_THEOR|nr:hypothetical protein MACJ_000470 [Theileria orientalis]